MGYSSFVELIPPEKNKEMCGDRQVKRPEPGTPHVEEDPGWSLLELISRRPGRRRNEDGKAMRSLIGDASAAATLGDPQDLRASLPRAHVLFPPSYPT